jgi:hypothetical protein
MLNISYLYPFNDALDEVNRVASAMLRHLVKWVLRLKNAD